MNHTTYIKIVGEDGSFGKCLINHLSLMSAPKFRYSPDAPNVILAVPLGAYEEVAKAHEGKHLINVCSVQKPSTDICLNYSDKVTSIHPLFGARTPLDADLYSILTYETPEVSEEICQIFRGISVVCNSDPETHDRHMAKTHLQVVLLQEQIRKIVADAVDVPNYFLTPSFQRIRDLANQFLDMPEGTRSSILANPFRYEKEDSDFMKRTEETLNLLKSKI